MINLGDIKMTLLIILTLILALSLGGGRTSARALSVLEKSLQRQNKVTFATYKK
tara:strand:- start:220 stop:381 length:162 start_codon:yes stop_codon:yes gene_type:complete